MSIAIAGDLAAALDVPTFARSLGIELDDWQARALRSRADRQLWLCARQVGKSTAAALLALHRAVYTPGSLVLMISPSQRQSGELYRKVREYHGRMPAAPALKEDTTTSCTFMHGSRVVSLPSSEATVRGFSGVDLLLEDEAARVPDDLHAACAPMVAVSRGQVILLSTAWGRRGHFHTLWEEAGPDWERIRVTAAECTRYPPGFLSEQRQLRGPLFYASEFECVFTETEDSVFKLDDIHAALSDDVLPLWGGD